jgi:hypothetical protein
MNLNRKKILAYVGLGLSFCTQAWSRPHDLQNYLAISGGEATIPANAYMDGSIRNQGLQPDYYLDVDHEVFRPLFDFAESLKYKSDLTLWQKVEQIERYIQTQVLEPTAYDDPAYLKLLEEFREQKTSSIDLINIPLSEYAIRRKGVCREHALMLHFALKKAGIPNQHVYAKVETGPGKKIENHAVISLDFEQKKWIIDSYFPEFNGYLYSDLVQGIESDVQPERRTPFAEPTLGNRRIVKILPYPIVWVHR